MIILKQLYSETDLFQKVKFTPGLNIIQGIYKSTEKEKSELNGIGKSTLIRLIDFALLSDTVRTNYFNPKRYDFLQGHSVTLEFGTENESYFIKRSFDEPNNPLFGTDSSKLEAYEISELRRLLGNQFFGKSGYSGLFDTTWFRSLIKFFIKDDINRFQRVDPLSFVDQHTRKYQTYAYNLSLLDLPNKSVVNFDDLTRQTNDLRKQKNRLLSRFKEDTGKNIQEINSEIRVLDDKISDFEKSVKDYKFLETYKDVEDELIKISSTIGSLLKNLTVLQRKLNEYKRSYEYDIEFDKDKVVRLYSELKTIAGEIVNKELNNVISFRKKLAENRMAFLSKREIQLKSEISVINNKISNLEGKRATLYKILDEKKALDSLKNTYTLLIEEKTKKERLVSSVSQVDDIDKKIYELNQQITKTISDISTEISSTQKTINKISSIFFEIINACISTENTSEVVFDIRPSPDIKSPLDITVNVPKSSALGKSRFRILAYDLTVFLDIIEGKRNLPHFLIHDGVFHSIDIKIIVRILNYIHSKFLQYQNFQYIVTANENEILVPENKKEVYGHYNFPINDHIIVTYKDIPEEMIFGREY